MSQREEDEREDVKVKVHLLWNKALALFQRRCTFTFTSSLEQGVGVGDEKDLLISTSGIDDADHHDHDDHDSGDGNNPHFILTLPIKCCAFSMSCYRFSCF